MLQLVPVDVVEFVQGIEACCIRLVHSIHTTESNQTNAEGSAYGRQGEEQSTRSKVFLAAYQPIVRVPVIVAPLRPISMQTVIKTVNLVDHFADLEEIFLKPQHQHFRHLVSRVEA